MAKQAEAAVAAAAPVQEFSPANPGQEKMYWIGLTADAPVHSLRVPTHPKFKVVCFSKHTGRLDEHPLKPTVSIKTERGNLGSAEKLFDYEVQAAMRFIETHGWVVKPQPDEVKGGTVMSCKKGEIALLKPAASGDVIRSPRTEADHVVPMADYVWIVPSENKGHYPGVPTTLSEQKKSPVAVA